MKITKLSNVNPYFLFCHFIVHSNMEPKLLLLLLSFFGGLGWGVHIQLIIIPLLDITHTHNLYHFLFQINKKNDGIKKEIKFCFIRLFGALFFNY
jgi:hypothetical protein